MSNLKFQAFQHLKEFFGDRAETVVEYIESQSIGLNEERAKNLFLSKQDAKEIFATKEDLLKTENKLTEAIANTKTDLLRWFFGFFVTIVLLIVGLYLKK